MKRLKICCKYYLNDIWETLILKKRKGMIFYHPQTKFAKVMFLQVSVCPQGGVPAQVHPLLAGTPPGRNNLLGQVHPKAGTSPRQVHPPGRYTPQAGTPPRQVHPQQLHPRAGTPPRQVHTPRQVPHQPQCMLGYSQQAGGMHSMGMHSCYCPQMKFGAR